ncbi:MAG: DUF6314 family protein [Opitutales bacterium]
MKLDTLTEQVFRFFEGEWQVRRDFEGSYSGTFTGKASFMPKTDESSVYSYEEEGELTDGEGKCYPAKQCYRYRFAEKKVLVFKREESAWILMHELDFQLEYGLACARHLHLCGEDHYATIYQADLAAGKWAMSYEVNGPKKAYQIRSAFERVAK